MKRRSYSAVIICIMGVMLFSGCGNPSGSPDSVVKDITENSDVSSEEEKAENNSEVQEEPVKKEEQVEAEPEKKTENGKEASGGMSLAQRMAGKYSYHNSDEDGNEEFYVMEVVPFGDNLYAFCGQAMAEDTERLEAYSFWASEFIPYDADEMTSTEGDTVTVNELRFSIMSNAGMYWDAGCKGTVTLTDDGLVFEGFENEGFLVPDYDDSRLFLKDDRVEDAFSYLKDDKTEGPEELQGLWVHSQNNSDTYIEFSGSNMYIYSKDPDKEVFYTAGGCEFKDGSFDFMGSTIQCGSMPFEFTGGYELDGDELTLEILDADVPELLAGRKGYRRIPDGSVHVTTMDEVQLTSDSFGMYGGEQDYEELRSQGYYGVFVSSAKSQEACTPTIEKLEDAGFMGVSTVYTPDFDGLNPEPYYSVTTGLFMSENDAKEELSEVKKAGFTDAFVKYAGSYTGDRYWYTMYGSEKIDVLKDGVLLGGVSLTIPYLTESEPVKAYLLVPKDSVFDSSAKTEFFGNYEKGDTPYDWIVRNINLMKDDPDKYQMNGPALLGVFEISLDKNRITKYYGSYWWD